MAEMPKAEVNTVIMEEKKPKRPRIGALPTSTEITENNGQGYQPRPYTGTERPDFGQRGFQPRPRINYHTPYNYRNREEGGYPQRPQRPAYPQRPQGSYNRLYQQRSAEEQPAEGEYQQQNQEGGYQLRQQQGYNRQGGYQQRPRQNNYNRNGGYNRQGGYQQRNQDGSYRQSNSEEGGYQPLRQGGYNNNRMQNNNRPGGFRKHQGGFQKNGKPGMKFTPRPRQIDYVIDDVDPNEPIRLNKFMANAGICSRREADEKIAAGLVTVNDVVVTELGTKINRDDVVKCEDKVVTPERKCYVLLNKPKDCVTTSDDPNGRLTVLDVVKGACKERIYPVGRLDRNTTGVLLLTNDGELASKLTHPKFVKKKIYHVWTDRDISEEDMQRIADGIELDDGEIHADAISYANETDRNQAGIEIHSGRNRIVRRIFEHLGYRVTKLDRVYFAGLTKKNLPRGRWRYLTQEEVNFLRMGSFE